MAKLPVDLIDTNLLSRLLIGYCFLLLLDLCPFLVYVCLSFRLPLLGVQKSGTVWTPVELGGQKKSFAAVVRHFPVEANSGDFFLCIRASPYDIT